MKVELISYTPNPVWSCGFASSVCTDSEDVRKSLKSAMASGHDSVLEHAIFTFAIYDISRVCSHQLVRHRMASYAQKSQRYTPAEPNFIVPETIDADLDREYDEITRECFALYRKMIEKGVPEEDARYVLPQSISTDIVVTMNARELKHFFALRCCNRAQWEIREIAETMLAQCKRVCPEIFNGMGPSCVYGPCPEGKRSCGRGGSMNDA